jgi:hypothetical protein
VEVVDLGRRACFVDGGQSDRAADQGVKPCQRGVALVGAVDVAAGAAVAHFLHHAQALPDEALALDRAVGAGDAAPHLAAGDAPADGGVRESLAQAGALALVADVAQGLNATCLLINW